MPNTSPKRRIASRDPDGWIGTEASGKRCSTRSATRLAGRSLRLDIRCESNAGPNRRNLGAAVRSQSKLLILSDVHS